MPSAHSIDRNGAGIDPEIADGTWIVVPVFNEAAKVGETIRELRAHFRHVVCVDDGSSDGTWAVLEREAPHALRHLVNRGQGAALQTGTLFALRAGARRIAHFDADGQHRIEDLVRMVEAVASGECDIALGNRFAGDASQVPAARRALLRTAVLFHRVTSGIALDDVHNGLRVLSRRAAERMEITADRMAHASELVDLVARSGLPMRQIPVTIRYTDYSRAKGQRWSGSFRILFHYLVGRAFG
jgi:glycosyltransferase involved in cell wall biosynthesis